MKHNTETALAFGGVKEVEHHTLDMKYEDFKALESFLRTVGVRIRITTTDCETCTIQADNPYRTGAEWFSEQALDMGNDLMTDKEVKRYQM